MILFPFKGTGVIRAEEVPQALEIATFEDQTSTQPAISYDNHQAEGLPHQ